MNLGETGVGEERAFFVSAISGGDVAAACVSREIKNISVAPGGENDRVGGVSLYFSANEISRDDSFGVSIYEDDIEHLRLWKHPNRAGSDLPRESLIATEKKLLARLSPGVKRSRNLCATERAVGQQAPIFAGKGHALFDALIDDEVTDFRQPINIGFARAKIPAFDRVVKQAVDAVAVVLIIFGRIDPALRGDGMRPPRRILITEALYVVAKLAQGGRGGATSQAAADDDDL